MKFSDGVDALAKENKFLQNLTKVLLLIIGAELCVTLASCKKEPIIVERSSRGLELVRQLPFTRDESDLGQAIHFMMKARFDTNTVSPEIFLNQREAVLREAEQKDLHARGMTQTVIVRSLKVTNDEALVDLDRVISVGELRSALKAKLKITFEETGPTELNPYGLTLSGADPVEKTEERK